MDSNTQQSALAQELVIARGQEDLLLAAQRRLLLENSSK